MTFKDLNNHLYFLLSGLSLIRHYNDQMGFCGDSQLYYQIQSNDSCNSEEKHKNAQIANEYNEKYYKLAEKREDLINKFIGECKLFGIENGSENPLSPLEIIDFADSQFIFFYDMNGNISENEKEVIALLAASQIGELSVRKEDLELLTEIDDYYMDVAAAKIIDNYIKDMNKEQIKESISNKDSR